MHGQPIHVITMLTVVLMLIGVVSAHSSDEPDLIQLLQVVNDHTVPCEDRAAAQHKLIESSHDIRMLPIVFSNLADPIFSTLAEKEVSIEAAYVGVPGTGSAETDCLYLPVRAQIAYARFRIWKAFATNGEPEKERMQVYEELFEEAKSRIQVFHYIGESRRNWTPTVRKHILSIYQNSEHLAHTRYMAGHTLLDMHHTTPADKHHVVLEKVIATAWAERGSEFALLMGRRLPARDPRVAVLKLDWYDHDVQQARQAGSIPGAADTIDRYFGNISGMYRDRRHPMTKQELAQRDKRLELMREARETSDYTRLREFEAQLVEQQRKEFEQRVEKIDAWIAQNRDRLEREAAEFARERERERKRESQQQP